MMMKSTMVRKCLDYFSILAPISVDVPVSMLFMQGLGWMEDVF